MDKITDTLGSLNLGNLIPINMGMVKSTGTNTFNALDSGPIPLFGYVCILLTSAALAYVSATDDGKEEGTTPVQPVVPSLFNTPQQKEEEREDEDKDKENEDEDKRVGEREEDKDEDERKGLFGGSKIEKKNNKKNKNKKNKTRRNHK